MTKKTLILLATWALATLAATAQTEIECYIRSNNNINYYLYPPNDRFYNMGGTPVYTTTDNGKPFLGGTTAKGADCVWRLKEVVRDGTTYVQLIHKQTGKYLITRSTTKSDAFGYYLDDYANRPSDESTLFTLENRTSNDRRTVAIRPYGATGMSLNPKSDINKARNDAGQGYIQSYDASNANSQWILVDEPTLTVDGSGTSVTPAQSGSLPTPELRYTTNNKDPYGSTYQVYDGTPIAVDPTAGYVVRAITAYAFGGVTLYSYIETQSVKLVAPTITNPEAGHLHFSNPMSGISYRYTIDGTTPASESEASADVYYFADDSYTLKVRTYLTAGNKKYLSGTSSWQVLSAPTISIADGTATLSHPTAGAVIYCTTDGSTPTTGLAPYSAPVAVAEGSTVKAIAVLGGRTSAVRTKKVPVTSPKTPISSLDEITDANGRYRLTADVDASGFTGFGFGAFRGTLDGDFHTLTGLTRPLFETTDNATVCNLVLDEVSISRSGAVGAVVATAGGDTRIYNCGVLGSGSTVGSTDGAAGSIVGRLEGTSRVVNCYSYATVSGGNADNTGGIVGQNTVATQQNNLATMVVNCMFYGYVAKGYAVYGGTAIANNGVLGVNGYNYYRDGAVGTLKGYHNTWAAEEANLTRFEYYRAILNGNRRMAAWWITGETGDEALVAKWVLDPAAAPYPILKPWGRYPSMVNRDATKVLDKDNHWIERTEALPYQGRQLGTLTVHVNAGSGHKGSGATSLTLTLPVTDMDTLHHDYSYGKVQLPYYNTTFGNAAAPDNDNRYGGNYTDKVVTGWKVTAVVGGTEGVFKEAWEDGYNFADRQCTSKDLYEVSGRVFAQGGYYYVPEGVSEITIEAYWGKALYLVNKDYYHESVNVADSKTSRYRFAPAGKWDKSQWPATGWGDHPIVDAINNTNVNAHFATEASGATVYDQAIVLIGSQHLYNGTNQLGERPYTLMSADLDFDDEPDSYLAFQLGESSTPCRVPSTRFDFLPIPELGMVAKLETNSKFPAVGKMALDGHFEITETANIRFSEFLYDRYYHNAKVEAPLIINAGQFKEFIASEYLRSGDGTPYKGRAVYTKYIILGGNAKLVYFAEGCHNKSVLYTRHCALNVMGGEIGEVYLSGRNTSANSSYVEADNPHMYSCSGRIGTVAGAAEEVVKGDVVYQLDHTIIREFYGGGTNSDNKVMGNIDVTLRGCLIGYYCGGPQTGDMEDGKTITTRATGTTFGQYFGAGNGGTSYAQITRNDLVVKGHGTWWVDNYTPLKKLNDNSYYAKFRFEIWSMPPGDEDKHPGRYYYYAAQFSATEAHDVSSTLTGCTVLGDFYGAGNLGSVDGDVSSILTDTRVLGNVFGAGYSAAIPSFWVYTKDNITLPHRDPKSGICYEAVLGDSALYTWTNTAGATTPIGSATRNTATPATPNYLYTSAPLTDLGTVKGTVTLTIDGTSLIGQEGVLNSMASGNVFGGGNESKVEGGTVVAVKGQAQVMGSVYGGGNQGNVDGETKVTIGEQ